MREFGHGQDAVSGLTTPSRIIGGGDRVGLAQALPHGPSEQGRQVSPSPCRRNRAAGLTEQQILASRQGHGISPKDAVALGFARELVERHGQVTAGSIQVLRDHGFTDGEIAEIVAHVALNIFTNYFNIALDVDVDFPRVALHQVA